jgi:hypothetical protein
MIPATDISFRRSQETAGSSDRRAGWGWLLLCILLAGGFLFKALSAASSAPDRSDVAGASATARLADSEPYHTVNIEDLAEGDTVLARDPLTGRVQEKRVTRVYRCLSDHLRVLEIRGPDGTSRELKTTDEHPFWVVQEQEFRPAAELRQGDDFVGPDGEPQTLVSTYREDHLDGVAVYNIETEDYHTYFVAAHGSRAPPVLVHNCDVARAPNTVTSFADELTGSAQAARRHLRRNVPGSGGQVHHIIPWERRGHELVQRAARGGFDINGANNGIRLHLTQHLGSHPQYNAAVTRKLDDILRTNPNISDVDAARLLQQYADQLRNGLTRSGSMLH